MKKVFSLVVASFLLVMNGACMTPALYKKTTRNFEEQISSFLITKDGKQLIVVGKKFHYIFQPNDTLKFVLTWAENKRVQVTFSDFVISGEKVSGAYSLTVDNSNAEMKTLLLAKGFTDNETQTKLLYQDTLDGTRYLADKALPSAMQFKQPYTITMQENDVYDTSTVKRILLTPLAVTADGLLVIGAIPVFIVGAPIVFIADKVHQLSK